MFVHRIAQADYEILLYLHANRFQELDPILMVISAITTYISIALILAVLASAFIKKSPALKRNFLVLLAVLLIAALTSFTLKNIFTRERPFITYPEIEKLSAAGSSSFPSGHTLEVFALAMAFTVIFKRKSISIPLFIWALTVAYSRMALGVHYPGDIMGGLVFGLMIGWLIPWLFREKHLQKH